MTFDQWLAQVALGEATTIDYPDIATQALLEGLESINLAALAGTTPGERSTSELQDLFERGLREVKRSVPSRGPAGRLMKRYYSAKVAAGELAPRDGAARLVKLARDLEDILPSREYVGDGLGLAQVVGLYYSHDDVAPDDHGCHDEIDAALLDECRRLASSAPA